MSYIVLRGRWCNIVVLNVHATSKEKSDDSKDRFYEELQTVFFIIFLSTVRNFCQNILIQNWREDIFKPTIGDEDFNQDSNDNGVRIVNFATSKNLVVKSMVFPH